MLNGGLDWIAAAGTLLAAWLVGRLSPWGWVLHAANAGLWAWLMWRVNLVGLVVLEAVFFAQAVYYFFKWKARA